MKKIFLILIWTVNSVFAQDGTSIFSYGAGVINVKSEFVTPFLQENEVNVTPYLSKYETSISTTDKSCQYAIKLSKYNGWEGEPGFANVLEVNKGSRSLILKNADGWKMFSDKYANISSSGFFLTVPLNQEAVALIFQGWRYGTSCAWLTIVVLYKNDIQLVFNKEMDILNIMRDASSFTMSMQSNLQDFREDGTAFQSAVKHSIWLENGVFKFRNN